MTTLARLGAGSKLLALTLALGLPAGPIAVDAQPAEAAAKRCSAKMSISKPRQYAYTNVNVSEVGSKAKVTTIAHYKSTKATKNGNTTWRCSTSFKPKQKQ